MFLQKALRGGIPLTEQIRLSPEVKAHCEDLISQQYEWAPEKIILISRKSFNSFYKIIIISHDMALNVFELCLPFLDYICRWLQWDQFLPEDYMCNHYLCIIPLPPVILMAISIRNTTLNICKYLSWKVSHNVLKDMCLLCLTKTTSFWTIKLVSVWLKIN